MLRFARSTVLGMGFAIAALMACSSSATDPPSGADAAPDDIPPGAEMFEIQWGPLMVQPGVEAVQCVVVPLGNDEPIKIHEIRNDLGNLSHHYIVYQTPETEVRSEPYPCDSVENLVNADNGLPMMITQKAEETLKLPDGVAFEMEANQMIRLELHYINASDTPIEAMVNTQLITLPESEFEHAASFLFVGSPDINIPAGQSATLGPVYTPMPGELSGIQLFGFTGHQHQWGTDVYVAIAENESAPDRPVYDLPDFDWDEPETVVYDPPIEMPMNGGFRFQCDWTNNGTRTARFGEGVDDEMCFFWAYYYPSVGSRTCFTTEQFGGTDVCCPGGVLCDLIDDMF